MQVFRTFILFFLIITMFTRCSSGKQEEEEHNTAESIQETDTTKVDVIRTVPSLFSFFIQSTGKIKATRQQVFFAESSGTVTLFDGINDLDIPAGQRILEFDTRATLLKIERAKEVVFNGQLNYKSDLLSQESLLKNKRQSLKDTIYRKIRSSSGLTAAEIDLKELNMQMKNSVVKAPFSGKLANVSVNKGKFVRVGDEMFTLYTPDDLYYEAKILESDIYGIKIGLPVTIVPVSGNGEYKAVVLEINPLVDENGLILVKIKIKQTKGLLPGMTATGIIKVPEKKCLSVPKAAIVLRTGRPVVFTVENNHAIWHYVTLGKDNGKQAEILNGLTSGDQVIISNNMQLTNNVPVRIN